MYFSHSCHIPHQSCPHSSDHRNEVGRSVKVMKLTIMQFSSASYYSLLLHSNSLPNNLSSYILSPYSYLNLDRSRFKDLSNHRQCYTFLVRLPLFYAHEKRSMLRRFGNNKGSTTHNQHTRFHRSAVFKV